MNRNNSSAAAQPVSSARLQGAFEAEWWQVFAPLAEARQPARAWYDLVQASSEGRTMRAVWEGVYSTISPQIDGHNVHVWPFEAACPLDVRLFYYDRPGDVRMNRHDYFELLFLCSGELKMQIQGRAVPVHQGDMVVIGSTVFHRVLELSQPSPRIAVLYFLPDLLGADDLEYLIPFTIQDERFPYVVPASSQVPAEAFHLMERIQSLLPAATQSDRLYVKTCLKMILAALVRHYSSYRSGKNELGRKQRNIEKLQPVFDFVATHFNEPVSVADVAGLSGASETHFTRLFRAVTGQSFLKYLNHYRISRAQILLAATDKSIAEIAMESGFYDHSHFGLTFRHLVHMTPRDYRRKMADDRASQAS